MRQGATRYGACALKAITVREVAEALDISTRAVLLRREKGALKGVMVKNDRGVDEYRIYPTKEIIEGLRRIGSPLVASTEAAYEFDIVDAQTVTSEPDKHHDSTYGEDDVVEASLAGTEAPRVEPSQDTRGNTSNVADQLWNGIISRFIEELSTKDQLIGSIRNELQEKERQLLLLPDLKKRAAEEAERAEIERKTAELNKLESIALQTQIQALKEEQGQSEDAKAKVLELEQALEESRAEALLEIERIREEKDAQTKAVQQQLEALSASVEKLQQPWWKKMLGTST